MALNLGQTFDRVVEVHDGECFSGIDCVFSSGIVVKQGGRVLLDGCTFQSGASVKFLGEVECSKCVFRTTVRVIGPRAMFSCVACDFLSSLSFRCSFGLLCCSGGRVEMGRGCRMLGRWNTAALCSVGSGSSVVMRHCKIQGKYEEKEEEEEEEWRNEEEEKDLVMLLEEMQWNEQKEGEKKEDEEKEDEKNVTSFGVVACAGGMLSMECCQIQHFGHCGALSIGGGQKKNQKKGQNGEIFNSAWGCHSCDSSDSEDRSSSSSFFLGEGIRCLLDCRIERCEGDGILLHRTSQCVMSDTVVQRVRRDGVCVGKKSSCLLREACVIQHCARGLVVAQMSTSSTSSTSSSGVKAVEMDDDVRIEHNQTNVWTCWSDPIVVVKKITK